MNQGRRAVCGVNMLFSLGAVVFSYLAWCCVANAAVRPEAEYGKYAVNGSTVQPLGSSPFGESINLYDGDLSFRQADVEISGNGPTIKLVRSFRARETGKTHENIGMYFYDWGLEIPRVKTITPVHFGGYPNDPRDWQLGGPEPYARCTKFSPPPTLSYWGDAFAPTWEPGEWWDGYFLVDGEGDSELLLQHSATPSYPIATKGGWRIECLSSTANGQPGEAFLGTAPDGTRYWFNHLIYTYAEPLIKEPRQLDRRYAAMLVTRIEDRFGNWLVYHYDNDKLTSINASDGRHVTIAYSDAYNIASITVDTLDTPSRSWTYQGANWTLSAVINPDGSRWAFALNNLSHAPAIDPSAQGCLYDPLIGQPSPISGSITAPSGVTGTFGLQMKKHGRSYVYRQCWGDDEFNTYAWYPKLWYSYTLASRVLTGPGLASQTWSYAYSPANDSWEQDCPNPASCPSTIWTDVTDPKGTRERHLFSNKSDHTETLLLKTEVYPQGSGSPVRVINNTYAVSNQAEWPYPWPQGIGSSYVDRSNKYITTRWTPLSKREIQQDGVSFVWQVNTFDTRARPLSVTRASTLGYSRTDATAYHDNLSKWVLGQVASSTCTAPASCAGLVESKTDYDANAMPWKTYAFGKLQQTLTYDVTSAVATGQRGTLKTATDGNNNVTTFTQWKRGIPQKIAFADAKYKSALVDDLGQLTWVEDENRYRTCYGYDAMGRLAGITYPSEAAISTCNTSTWAKTTVIFAKNNTAIYGLPAGHWKQIVATGNARKDTYFDALWRPVVTSEYDNANIAGTLRQSVTRYDVEGRPIFSSYPQRSQDATVYNTWANPAVAPNATGTDTVYDALGRVLTSKADSELPGQLTTTYEYLSSFQTKVTNPRGFAITYRYYAYDQPTTDQLRMVTHPEGAITEIWRDAFGKPLTVLRRNSDSTVSVSRTYAYTSNTQELCRTVEPETGATDYGYDAAGNLKWSAAGLPSNIGCDLEGDHSAIAPRRVDRTYDARNRLKTLVFPDGKGNQTWTYTPDGLAESIVTDNGGGQVVANAYAYNKRRLMTDEDLTLAGVFSWPIDYGYDVHGHLTVQNWHGVSVGFSPNALGQPTRAGTYVTNVSYYPNGAMRQFTYGNGLTHTLTQNVRGLPDISCDFYTSCPVTSILNDGYDYDQNGNVAAISDGVSTHRGNRTLTYDGLDRLKTAVSPMYGNAAYAYDVLDNQTRVTVGGTAARDHYYCYDAANRLTNVKTGSCAGTSVIGLGYDVQGNLSNKNGVTYSFDFGNRLRSTGAPANVTYAYDGHGRRVMDQTPAGVKYSHYNQAGQLTMTGDDRADKVIEYIHLNGSLVATRERDTLTNVYSTRYHHTDALGSPVAVTDESRAMVKKSEYEPFGFVNNRPAEDGPGYTGHVLDAATGLNYMQQRYYDPKIGRFLSRDPVTADAKTGANFNVYWYANNNPYKFIDPDGRIVKISSENTDSDKKKMADAIDKLLSTKSGAAAFKKLNDSKNVFVIKKDGSRIRTQAIDQSKADSKQSVGATIYFDADKKTGGKDSTGSTKRPGYVDLAHEFGHAIALDSGTQSFDRGSFLPGTTPPSEEQSMELENAVRQEHGLPLRPSYYFK